ncbi:MAG: peptidylprolyl isomerase [Bacteroidales bacterium]|nr:peptidylprolyl isomerase [Bacteroidales bacterium]
MRKIENFKLIGFLILLITGSLGYAQNILVDFKTELGVITIELYSEKAPITVGNFLQYVDENRLDSSTFYRVVRADNQQDNPVKIQVIQGGLFEDEHPKMLPAIEHESTKETGILHLKGAISMARYGPGTATSEFFICMVDEPELDAGGMRNADGAGFAAFGKVVEGMDVAEKIHKSKADDQYLNPRILIYSIRRK